MEERSVQLEYVFVFKKLRLVTISVTERAVGFNLRSSSTSCKNQIKCKILFLLTLRFFNSMKLDNFCLTERFNNL